MQVPHLTTALTGPLLQLERTFLQHQTRIEAWFREQWRLYPPPPYASVDLRNAGFKLAPVDTNLFPAGFNNLNPDFMPLCVQAAQATFDKIMPNCTHILIVPESHTRNVHYLENIATLRTILIRAGYDTEVGTLLPITGPQDIALPSRRHLRLVPVTRKDDRLVAENFKPCLVLLNNDLSSGAPEILQGLKQPVVPDLSLGWFHRSKTTHFTHYAALARTFAELINIDPWLISPLFESCDNVDFMQQGSSPDLKKRTQDLFTQITEKYRAHQITQKPFVVIKADNGTYGMGVMNVTSADALENLSRKERTRMSATKGGQTIHKVLIQEGVYTFETWGEPAAVAEPVVYLIGPHVVGGFYRVHTERGPDENLNAPGMHFEPLAFAHHCNLPDAAHLECQENRFYAYGVIARLAVAAAAREAKENA